MLEIFKSAKRKRYEDIIESLLRALPSVLDIKDKADNYAVKKFLGNFNSNESLHLLEKITTIGTSFNYQNYGPMPPSFISTYLEDLSHTEIRYLIFNFSQLTDFQRIYLAHMIK